MKTFVLMLFCTVAVQANKISDSWLYNDPCVEDLNDDTQSFSGNDSTAEFLTENQYKFLASTGKIVKFKEDYEENNKDSYGVEVIFLFLCFVAIYYFIERYRYRFK